MATIRIWLKGWRDGKLFADAVNNAAHAMHEAAWPVYLNSFRDWRPGDPVYFAVQYDMPDEQSDGAICEDAFTRFNIGEPSTDPVVAVYRNEGRNRSLSVGDVVEIHRSGDDPKFLTCASVGWEVVDGFVPPRTADVYRREVRNDG